MSRRIPDDCTVRLIDLPIGIGGRISEAPDGHVDIYINARYGEKGRRRALDHELDHYERGDLHSDLPIEAVEARADLPPLRRARDLIPQKPQRRGVIQHLTPICPPPKPAPSCLTPHQLRTLLSAVADLDPFLCEPIY